ncbi:TetR family transcriptional regulator [Parafrigoribacterium soli]|uniref:TetR family transcriptional regulator n=1 Tax=Parafrigoribacterium soli TaxID=3144663 RepID=UPI0032EBB0BA
MGRWDPDARERLERAALELFAEQGFAATTVPQITGRAGLTTRTFFRYFADKREVLFSGEAEMRSQFADVIRGAPSDLSAMDLVQYALEAAAATIFEPRFADLRNWRTVVASDEGLRERALRKQQLSTETAIVALRERGLDGQTAAVLAGLASVLLQSAVGAWVEQAVVEKSLTAYIRESVEQLRSLVA